MKTNLGQGVVSRTIRKGRLPARTHGGYVSIALPPGSPPPLAPPCCSGGV